MRESAPTQASPGQALAWGLANFWQAHFRPARPDPRLKLPWQRFLVLEVEYFHPLRRGGARPESLARLGELLSGVEHLVRVLAGGDDELATEFRAPRHAAFWAAVVSPAEELTLSTSTVFSRRKAALERLAQKLSEHFGSERRDRTPSLAIAPTTSRGHPSDETATARSVGLPPGPTFVPPEWTPLFKRAVESRRAYLTAPVGTGKSCFLAALGHWLRGRGARVLLLNRPVYAHLAPDTSLVRTAIEADPAGRATEAHGARRTLQVDLEAAEVQGSLWVLADETDGLTRSEANLLARHLAAHRRVVVAERAARLQRSMGPGERLELPDLSALSQDRFIAALDIMGGKQCLHVSDLWPEREMTEVPMPPLAWLEFAARSWCLDASGYHPASVTERWIHSLLLRAPADSPAGGACETVLEELAACRTGLWDLGRPAPIDREAVQRAAHKAGNGDHADALLDHACASGILEAMPGDKWRFAHGVLELGFVAKHVAREASAWAAKIPTHRTVMGWAAALLARAGDEAATAALLNGIAGLREDRLGLRWPALADLLAEFDAGPSTAAQSLRPAVERGLRELARIESGRLRGEIWRGAIRLGWDDVVPEDEVAREDFEPDLTPLRTDLRGLLARLGRGDVKGDDEEALRDRRVIGALIHAGLRHPDADVAMRSAAWLHAAPLGEVLDAHGFPPRLRLAVEEVAATAVDRDLPEANRRAAWSALCRADLLPTLAAFGEAYLAQIHTLLLELGVGLVQVRDGEWVVLGGVDEG